VEKKNEKELAHDLRYKDVVDIIEIIDYSICRELHLELKCLNSTVIRKTESPPGTGRTYEG